MFLTTHIPSFPLNQYIALFAYYRGYNPDYTATRMLPEGTVELLIPLDEMPRVFYKQGDLKNFISRKRAMVCGMQQHYIYAQSDKGASMFAVKFKAGGCRPFLHLPLNKLNNLFVEADQIFGPAILSLRERLLTLDNPYHMVSLVEQFLLSRLQNSMPHQAVMNYALTQIVQPVSLKSIAAEIGYSQKQFIHRFKQQIGLSPKYYQRVARFNQALKQIGTAATVDWAQLSYQCGFYDQAHLINEFKRFSGFTPTDYLAHRGEYPNFIPIYPSW